MGKSSSPPSPKVKASGGDPTTMSSGVERSTWCGHAPQAASTSRWLCTGALGCPVVPDVKAMSAMSSAAVGQAGSGAQPAARTSRSSAAGAVWKGTMARSTGCCACAACSSSSRRPSHSAAAGWARSITSDSSRARSSGMVATAIRPACTTASQASAISGVLPPRSSTRLPGTRPRPSTSTRAMRATSSCACA